VLLSSAGGGGVIPENAELLFDWLLVEKSPPSMEARFELCLWSEC